MKKLVVQDDTTTLVDAKMPGMDKANRVLVQVKYSAVSPGTEVKLLGRGGMEGKSLGYSASGVAVEIGQDVSEIREGDPVVCYGAPYVHHAEYLSVPEVLCARLPSHEWLREGAFAGLGTIAINSVRTMGLQFGETVWVVGLGLLGQLVAQLCEMAAYRVIGTDLDAHRVEAARSMGIQAACLSGNETLGRVLSEFAPNGLDAVSLCLTSAHSEVLDEALAHLAHRGKLVLVGNVPMRFDRDLFFRKEAQLLVARAGGPGRYDARYEDEGMDYPQAYARWTEGRNLREYVRLLVNGKLRVAPYITHEFDFADAASVHGMLKRPDQTMLGVLFRYD